MNNLFDRINGGISIYTSVKNIPKGSGLGTSSILSGALLTAISKFLGNGKNRYDITNEVLKLEQLMSTGGGWQDQVGGIFPGIKIISTRPGAKQSVKVKMIELTGKQLDSLNERLVLINTGQRRLARNLLRNIVTKYISNEPITVKVLNTIVSIAKKQVKAIESNNYREFGKLLNKHWELIKQMDPGSSNLCIETIIKVIEDDVYGKALCGAGGGGFIVAILKDGISKETIKNKLEKVFADTNVQLYDASIINE